MHARTDDLRILEIRELITPHQVMSEYPSTDAGSAAVAQSRKALQEILHGRDDRLAVVIGPCSIHDTAAAMDYARRLREQRERFKGELEIIMRVYFEKPRTTVGWKGPSTIPISMAASISIAACALRASCYVTSTILACRPVASSSTSSRRSTLRTWSRGVQSVRAQRRVRSIVR
jgi:phospho-2-dehydro-3-deoxyheptonate aldolase